MDNESLTNETLKEAYKNFYNFYQKDNPLFEVDWEKEKNEFLEQYNSVQILTFGGLYLRHDIFQIIYKISEIQDFFETNNTESDHEYVYQLENFIFRSIQLRNLLLYFFREGVQSYDKKKYDYIKECFNKNVFLSQLKETYRNELTHKGHIFSTVVISDTNQMLPTPIIYLPNQEYARQCTFDKWKKEWAYSINYYLCLIKRLLDKIK